LQNHRTFSYVRPKIFFVNRAPGVYGNNVTCVTDDTSVMKTANQRTRFSLSTMPLNKLLNPNF